MQKLIQLYKFSNEYWFAFILGVNTLCIMMVRNYPQLKRASGTDGNFTMIMCLMRFSHSSQSKLGRDGQR